LIFINIFCIKTKKRFKEGNINKKIKIFYSIAKPMGV